MIARLLLSALVCCPMLHTAPATAAVSQKKAIWGPTEREGVSQFPKYASLGVGIYQMTLKWDQVAARQPGSPRSAGDPAYVWPPEVDYAISEASRHGIQVLLNVTGSPRWANRNRAPHFAPARPSDYGDFVEAASRRYPRVRHWMIWSEPSKGLNFQPLTPDNNKPLRGAGLRGPRLYARMLDSAYGRLKSVTRSNIVIGGNTFTVGTVAPYRYLRAMRMPNGRAPRLDLWGHNPFSRREPNLRKPPLGYGYADFSDLDTLMRWLDRYVRPRGPRLKVFISEYTLPTDHANFVFNFHVSRARQADWIAKALRIVRSHKRLYTFGYFNLYDPAPRLENDQPDWGLLEFDGDPKPAYASFKAG